MKRQGHLFGTVGSTLASISHRILNNVISKMRAISVLIL
jgi:hypothetical protein